ncbi:hypothetical protein MYX64_13175, partial [Nitrospinae bacterium AH_259_B05_G02_I21]|nr:hypothetical protein [Nitrospinae bacterium AH_259_B05_G02_I21]
LVAIAAGAVILVILLLQLGQGRAIALLCTALAFSHLWAYRGWIFAAPAKEVQESLNEEFLLTDDPIETELKSNQFRIALGGRSNWIHFLL